MRVSAARVMEGPVFVCLRGSCKSCDWSRATVMFVRLALKVTQNSKDLIDVILLYTNSCQQYLTILDVSVTADPIRYTTRPPWVYTLSIIPISADTAQKLPLHVIHYTTPTQNSIFIYCIAPCLYCSTVGPWLTNSIRSRGLVVTQVSRTSRLFSP
jgi:hypothetical protein